MTTLRDIRRTVSNIDVEKRSPIDQDPIYKMGLHEIMPVETSQSDEMWTSAMRVPGGWIYRSMHKGEGLFAAVFVPFDNEWQPRRPSSRDSLI